MTGLDVLIQCQRYESDMEKMRNTYSLALDAALKVTQSFDGIGVHSGEVASAPERFAAISDGVSRRMESRRVMYSMELEEALRLLQFLPAPGQTVVRLRMIEGHTVRMVAAETHGTLDGVRSHLRRCRAQLAGIDTKLGEDPDYLSHAKKFEGKRKP